MFDMNNIKNKLLIAGTTFTLAFAFGVVVWKRQPLSLCTMTEYRSVYQFLEGDNFVNLKGNLYGGETLALGDIQLNGCEGNSAEIILADEGKLSLESQALISELRNKTNISKVRGEDHNDKFARAEVEIIGTLTEREQYCYTSRYVLTAVEITPVGSVEVLDATTLANEYRK